MMNGRDEVSGLDARQDGQRQFRTDTADRDQALEEVLLETCREPVEQQRILADVRVDAKRDLGTGLTEAIERGERHQHVVADTVHIDHDPIGLFLGDATTELRDHGRAGL